MQAVVLVPGGSDVAFAVRDLAPPLPGPNDLLVAMKSAGLNRADLLAGHPTKSARADGVVIAGREVAGEVIAAGSAVTGFKPGDAVMAMADGCFAEQVIVDPRLALRVPGGMDWPRAAAIPIVYATAHDALVSNGAMAKGETVLINAASSGVGIAAIQVARLLGAGFIAATTGSTGKLAALRELGADLIIEHHEENFADALLARTEGHGADVIIDNIGAGVLADNIRVAAIRGRIVSVGRLGGRTDRIDLDEVARKRIRLIGVTFRTRTPEERIAVVRRFAADCLGQFAKGRLWPIVDRTFPLTEGLAALGYMRSNAHLGKIVLTA